MPMHSEVAEGVAVTDTGLVLMVMAIVEDTIPQLLVAVNVYTPAEAVFTVNAAGLRSVDE